jgi:hypothetical protein
MAAIELGGMALQLVGMVMADGMAELLWAGQCDPPNKQHRSWRKL